MPKPSPVILITRPAHQSASFAARFDTSVECVLSPVLEIRHLPPQSDVNDYSALVFASQNAVLAACESVDLRGRRVFAVGEKTGALASMRGAIVTVADGTAKSLVDTIKAAAPDGPVLFLRGRHSTGEIVSNLSKAGIAAQEEIIYEQDAKKLTPQAAQLLKGTGEVILPLFSVRSATILAKEANEIGATAPLTLVGISNAVRDAWHGPEPKTIHVAQSPGMDEMCSLILRHIGQPG